MTEDKIKICTGGVPQCFCNRHFKSMGNEGRIRWERKLEKRPGRDEREKENPSRERGSCEEKGGVGVLGREKKF